MADVELSDALPQLGVYPVLPTVALTTGASPQTYDGTPAVVAITSGGTGGTEDLDLLLPDLPFGGFMNPYIVGQRVVFCLVAQTDPGDSVVITAGGSGTIRFYPTNNLAGALGMLAGAVLDFVGAAVCFVWCGDGWLIDYALTNNQFDGAYETASALIKTQLPAGTDADGEDILFSLAEGRGAGRQGLFIINTVGGEAGQTGLPTTDLGVDGNVYYDPGAGNVLKYRPPS